MGEFLGSTPAETWWQQGWQGKDKRWGHQLCCWEDPSCIETRVWELRKGTYIDELHADSPWKGGITLGEAVLFWKGCLLEGDLAISPLGKWVPLFQRGQGSGQQATVSTTACWTFSFLRSKFYCISTPLLYLYQRPSPWDRVPRPSLRSSPSSARSPVPGPILPLPPAT